MQNTKFKLLESVSKGRGKRIELFSDKLQDEAGKIFIRDVVKHPGAAVIIPKLDKDLFILVRQYRHAIKKELLEFPAGTIDPGESALSCAKREIQEETKFAAKSWQELNTIYPAPGFCDEIQCLFLASELYASPAKADDGEQIEVFQLSSKEIETAIIKHEICDAKSIAAYFLLSKLQS